MKSEIIFVSANGINIKVPIPDIVGNIHETTVIWIRHITDKYIQASLKTKDDGYTIWLCEIFSDGTIQPISCTMYLDQDEVHKVILMEKLHIKGTDINDKLLQDRIERINNECN